MPTVLPPTKADKPQPEEEIKQQALTVIERAATIKIVDQTSYNAATDMLTKEIKPMRSKWEAYWKGSDAVPGPVKLAYKTYKSLLDKFNEADEKLAKAEKDIKAEIVRFDDEQRRIQEEKQRKAQEEAERLEQARRTEQAVELEAQGVSEEEIESMMDAPVMAVAPPVTPTYQKASGVSMRENWRAKVHSVKDLCKAIGAGKLKFAPSDEKKIAEFFEGMLAARARADKSTISIPGVTAYNDPIVAGRGR